MGARNFAPLPLRAGSDKRLTVIHYRVLIVVAGHDGMSVPRGKGQGCWASTTTLAQECASHISNVSTAIGELENFGYISREKHPTRKKTWVLRVLYDVEDHLPGDKTSAREDLPNGKTSIAQEQGIPDSEVVLDETLKGFTHHPDDVLPASTKLFGRPDEKMTSDQSAGNQNIFPEGEKILLKQEKSSVETASSGADARAPNDKTGMQLAIAERLLGNGKPASWTDDAWSNFLTATKEQCEAAIEGYECGHPNHGRALRVLQNYDL